MIEAFRRVGGGGAERAAAAALVDDGAPALAGHNPADRDVYWRVGAFLFEQALPPSPAYYLLGHVFVLRTDPGVVAAVEAAIAEGARLSPAVADTILAVAGLGGSTLSPAHLARIADETAARVDRFAGLVDRSREDARSFGDALEANAAGIAEAAALDRMTATALLDMTRAMIAATRLAEARLRQTAGEMDDLRAKLAAARADAETDSLTGLINRRAFDRRFGEARARAIADGTPLVLALIDIDRFKDVNDAHGHEVGDRVLQLFAKILREGCAPHPVARRGGEEFALLFAQTDAAAAFALVDAARETMAARTLRVAETRRTLGQLTFSGGVAAFDGAESGEALLRRADALLYRAKQAGRNRLEA